MYYTLELYNLQANSDDWQDIFPTIGEKLIRYSAKMACINCSIQEKQTQKYLIFYKMKIDNIL